MKQDTLQLQGRAVPFQVVHRPRVTRRIHLEIDREGNLLVVAPRRMSRRAIKRALQGKSGHVSRFLQDARSKQQELADLTYTSGEKHLYLGERIPLAVNHQAGKRVAVREMGGSIHVKTPDPSPEKVKSLLERWYRQQAEQWFTARLEYYSARAPWTSDRLPPLRLRRMKRTWGSCSSSGVITLNPHLVKSPAECIDYVVAHEICHLREHNHGRAFYALQEQLYPCWREAKTQLKNRGHLYLHS